MTVEAYIGGRNLKSTIHAIKGHSKMNLHKRTITILMYFHDGVNLLLSFIKRNQKIKPSMKVVKVNLGSGLKVAPGWINVNGHFQYFLSKYPVVFLKILYKVIQSQSKDYTQEEYCSLLKNHTFIYHNLKYGIPFDNNSIDYLYSSHVLEHFFWTDAEQLVKEAYRVLKTGGIFRVCVPNLEYAVALYNKGEKKEALSYFFNQSKVDNYSYHRYMYDYELLKELLSQAGFSKIKRYSCQEGSTPDIDILDHLPQETLYVEAYKNNSHLEPV